MEVIETMGIVKYNITDATISEMKDRYMGLTVKDFDDKEGFDAVHEARMVVKGKRVDVEKRRKELKADALEYGKKVDSEAKRITKLMEPIETHLRAEEDKITKEKERRKAEEERIFKEKIDKRVSALMTVNKVMDFMAVASMTDEEFEGVLKLATEEYKAEQKRIEEEIAAREVEEARLKAEREENERKEAELKAEREKIEAEKRAIEEEKRKEQERKDREEFERQAKIQAAKEARFSMLNDIGYTYPLDDLGVMPDSQWQQIYNEHKKAWDEKQQGEWLAEKKEVERKAKEEAERQEALKPDKEKLVAWVSRFSDTNIAPPQLQSETANTIYENAIADIEIILQHVLEQVEVM